MLRTALAGAAATFAGIGLSRFAYVPLFPAMVTAGWVTGPQGGLLGALNLAGYLAGVLGGRMAARSIGTAGALDAAMLLVALSLGGCAWNGGLAWLAVCRFLAGLSGGTLMALAGPAVQGAVPAERRGAAGGVVMAGVGAGVMISSVAVPAVLPAGLSATWLAVAGLVILVWVAAHPNWPRTPVPVGAAAGLPGRPLALYAAYGVSGAGLVPHMVYYGDLVVRGRGFDPGLASLGWFLFGLGGAAGTLVGGRAAGRFGAVPCLRAWIGIQLLAVGAALVPSPPLAIAAAFGGGFAAVGLTAVTLTRARELAGPASGTVWVGATAAFAICQAVTGFALAALFERTHSHDALFGVALALSAVALVLAFVGIEPARGIPVGLDGVRPARHKDSMNTRSGPDTDALLAGEPAALARAITLVESKRADHREAARALLDAVMPRTGGAVRLGITGVPGVGKSTLIDALGTFLTGSGHRVAVLAVDPSSTRTGGAILGDKTRMTRLAADPRAFIRPSPSSGSLGGVAARTREAMLLCEAAGFDVVLVETVGVGQSETAVADLTDFFLVLALPGAGDDLQGIKKGVIELADIIAVNKADGPGAARAAGAAADYRAALHILAPAHPLWSPPVILVSGLAETGLDELWRQVLEHRRRFEAAGEIAAKRRGQDTKWMWALVEERVRQRLLTDPRLRERVPEIEAAVADAALSPLAGADAIAGLLGI